MTFYVILFYYMYIRLCMSILVVAIKKKICSTEDKFDFTKLWLAKQDDKMAVIKGTNVTVNWYKSTETLQIQGVNEQRVKQFIWTSNHNGSQVITDGKDTSQVEFDSGVNKGDNATLVASSLNEGTENSSR